MDLPVEIYGTFIHRGSVLIKCHPGNINHPKMFVVMGVSEDSLIGFFFINSDINTHVINKPAQQELQYLIKESDYDFLDHDSYICASSLKHALLTDVENDFPSGEVRHIGVLNENDLNVLLEKLNNSSIYSARVKSMFFS